eukprot:gene11192-12480_t
MKDSYSYLLLVQCVIFLLCITCGAYRRVPSSSSSRLFPSSLSSRSFRPFVPPLPPPPPPHWATKVMSVHSPSPLQEEEVVDILARCAINGDVRGAEEALRQLAMLDLPLPQPSTHTHELMAWTFLRSNHSERFEEAEAEVLLLLRRGGRPPEDLLCALLEGLGLCGLPQRAVALFDRYSLQTEDTGGSTTSPLLYLSLMHSWNNSRRATATAGGGGGVWISAMEDLFHRVHYLDLPVLPEMVSLYLETFCYPSTAPSPPSSSSSSLDTSSASSVSLLSVSCYPRTALRAYALYRLHSLAMASATRTRAAVLVLRAAAIALQQQNAALVDIMTFLRTNNKQQDERKEGEEAAVEQQEEEVWRAYAEVVLANANATPEALLLLLRNISSLGSGSCGGRELCGQIASRIAHSARNHNVIVSALKECHRYRHRGDCLVLPLQSYQLCARQLAGRFNLTRAAERYILDHLLLLTATTQASSSHNTTSQCSQDAKAVLGQPALWNTFLSLAHHPPPPPPPPPPSSSWSSSSLVDSDNNATTLPDSSSSSSSFSFIPPFDRSGGGGGSAAGGWRRRRRQSSREWTTRSSSSSLQQQSNSYNKYHEVDRLLQKMESYGTTPDSTTYVVLLSIYSSSLDLPRMRALNQDMLRSSRSSSVLVSALYFNTLLRVAATSSSSSSTSSSPADVAGDKYDGSSNEEVVSSREVIQAFVQLCHDYVGSTSSGRGSTPLPLSLHLLRGEEDTSRLATALQEEEQEDDGFAYLYSAYRTLLARLPQLLPPARHHEQVEEEEDSSVVCEAEVVQAFQAMLKGLAHCPHKVFLPPLSSSSSSFEHLSSPARALSSSSTAIGRLGRERKALQLHRPPAGSTTVDLAYEVVQDLHRLLRHTPSEEVYISLLAVLHSALPIGQSSAPDRAMEIYDYLLAQASKSDDPSSSSIGVLPQEIYEQVLAILAASRRADSPRLAETLFRKMAVFGYRESTSEEVHWRRRRGGEDLFEPSENTMLPFRADVFAWMVRSWSTSASAYPEGVAEEEVEYNYLLCSNYLGEGPPELQSAFLMYLLHKGRTSSACDLLLAMAASQSASGSGCGTSSAVASPLPPLKAVHRGDRVNTTSIQTFSTAASPRLETYRLLCYLFAAGGGDGAATSNSTALVGAQAVLARARRRGLKGRQLAIPYTLLFHAYHHTLSDLLLLRPPVPGSDGSSTVRGRALPPVTEEVRHYVHRRCEEVVSLWQSLNQPNPSSSSSTTTTSTSSLSLDSSALIAVVEVVLLQSDWLRPGLLIAQLDRLLQPFLNRGGKVSSYLYLLLLRTWERYTVQEAFARATRLLGSVDFLQEEVAQEVFTAYLNAFSHRYPLACVHLLGHLLNHQVALHSSVYSSLLGHLLHYAYSSTSNTSEVEEGRQQATFDPTIGAIRGDEGGGGGGGGKGSSASYLAAADHLLATMQCLGYKVSAEAYSAIFKMVAASSTSKRYPQRTFEAFRHVVLAGGRVDNQMLTYLLQSLLRSTAVWGGEGGRSGSSSGNGPLNTSTLAQQAALYGSAAWEMVFKPTQQHLRGGAISRQEGGGGGGEPRHPPTFLYNLLLSLYTRSTLPHAPDIVQGILEEMIAQSTTSSTTNSSSSSSSSSSTTTTSSSSSQCSPDLTTFNTVLTCYVKYGLHYSDARVTSLLQAMTSLHVQPDVVTYTILLQSLGSKGRAPELASQVFASMQRAGVVPDVRAWTILITIWAESDREDKELQVKALLQRMKESGLKPNVVTYTTMLTMWGRSRLPQAAEEVAAILRTMQRMHQTLDPVLYASLLSALAQSSPFSANNKTNNNNSTATTNSNTSTSTSSVVVARSVSYRALDVLSSMRKQGMLPNVIHWSIVLHIWCTSEEVDKEEVVPRLFAEMVDKDGVSPNAVTYTSLLSLWSKSTNRSVALDNVQRIYQRLLVDLPPLDGKSFQLLVNALLRHLDSPATALAYIDRLLTAYASYAIPLDPAVYRVLLSQGNKLNEKVEDRKRRALAIADFLTMAGGPPQAVDKALYEGLLVLLCTICRGEDEDMQSRALDKAHYLLHHLVERGVRPSLTIFARYLQGLAMTLDPPQVVMRARETLATLLRLYRGGEVLQSGAIGSVVRCHTVSNAPPDSSHFVGYLLLRQMQYLDVFYHTNTSSSTTPSSSSSSSTGTASPQLRDEMFTDLLLLWQRESYSIQRLLYIDCLMRILTFYPAMPTDPILATASTTTTTGGGGEVELEVRLLATLARQQEEGATKVSALLATFDRYFFTLRVHLYRIENDSSSSTSTAVTLLPRLQQTLRHILPLFLRLIRSDARYSHMLPRLVATLRHSLTAESRASSQRRYWEK